MNFFDLHCDTIGECCNQKKRLCSNDLHISLEKAECFDKYGQIFAIWIPDEKREKQAFDYFDKVYQYFSDEIKANEKVISFCKSGSDIKASLDSNKIAAILSVESGAALGGDISKLDYLYNCGVRLITLTWSGQNELGDGCFCENASGLTDFGKATALEMQKKNMLVDVSHLSEKGFYDVAELTQKPFVASHSNCQTLVKNKRGVGRNLSDEQIKIIIEKNGLIGLNFCEDFLGDNGDTGKDAVLRHIYHFLELGAQNNIAFGCDYDGCTVNEELNGLESILPLFEYLESKGLQKNLLDNIFFNNTYRFMIANI